MSIWQRRQEREIRILVEDTFKNQMNPPSDGWIRWVTEYLCRRFQDLDRWEWKEALAMMDDETLLWQHSDGKAALYLKQVRNYARGI